ncbi:hypothetical protein [Pseudoneobacillus sp. C159]
MSNCNIDHSIDDLKNKFESQQEFLPADLLDLFTIFFTKEHSQDTLNEVFHLLKKYDLSSEEEQQVRNEKLLAIFQKA